MALQPAESTRGVESIPVVLYGRTLEANRRIPLNFDWVDQVRVNTSAVERRAAFHSIAACSSARTFAYGVPGLVPPPTERMNG